MICRTVWEPPRKGLGTAISVVAWARGPGTATSAGAWARGLGTATSTVASGRGLGITDLQVLNNGFTLNNAFTGIE